MSEKKPTHRKITATYKSGREEVYILKLTTAGLLRQKDRAVYQKLASIPTVVNVKYEDVAL